MKRYILLLVCLFITVLNPLSAKVDVWKPIFPVQGGYQTMQVTENLYLASYSNLLQVHAKDNSFDTIIQFKPNSNLLFQASYSDIITVYDNSTAYFYTSFDGARTWDSTSAQGQINAKLYVKNASNFLLISENKVLRSINGGLTWNGTSNKNIGHKVNGEHLLVMYNDHLEISHDFGNSFKSISLGGIWNVSGDISADGEILISVGKFGLPGETKFSSNDGTSWSIINQDYYNGIHLFNSQKALLGKGSEFQLIQLPGNGLCPFEVQDYGFLLNSSLQIIRGNDYVHFYYNELVSAPASMITCSSYKRINNPNIKLDWVQEYTSNTSDIPVLGGTLFKSKDKVIYRINTNTGMINYEGDTLSNHNFLLLDSANGKIQKAYHSALGPKVYYPTLYQLPEMGKFLHIANQNPDTIFLSPDKQHFLVFPWYSKLLQTISILDPELNYEKHFNFEGKLGKSLYLSVQYITQKQFHLLVSSNDSFQFISMDGDSIKFPSGRFQFRFNQNGDMVKVIPWESSGTLYTMLDEQYLIVIGINFLSNDSFEIGGKIHVIPNATNSKYLAVQLDSSNQIIEYYLIKDEYGSPFNPIQPWDYSGESINNLFKLSGNTNYQITSSQGQIFKFNALNSTDYHLLQFNSAGSLKHEGSRPHGGFQSVGSDSTLSAFYGSSRIQYDPVGGKTFVPSNPNEFYLTLNSANYAILGDIGPIGALTHSTIIYLDYPSIYFAASVGSGFDAIPGSYQHLLSNSSILLGKMTIQSPLSSIAKVPEKLILLYPNPTQSTITIACDTWSGNEVQIDVYDIQGRLIFQKQQSPIDTKVILDIASLQKSWYTIRIQDGNTVSSYLVYKY